GGSGPATSSPTAARTAWTAGTWRSPRRPTPDPTRAASDAVLVDLLDRYPEDDPVGADGVGVRAAGVLLGQLVDLGPGLIAAHLVYHPPPGFDVAVGVRDVEYRHRHPRICGDVAVLLPFHLGV